MDKDKLKESLGFFFGCWALFVPPPLSVVYDVCLVIFFCNSALFFCRGNYVDWFRRNLRNFFCGSKNFFCGNFFAEIIFSANNPNFVEITFSGIFLTPTLRTDVSKVVMFRCSAITRKFRTFF